MELNVNIDPDQINKMVADAVLESALGDAVKNVIDEQVKKLSSSYNNPLDSVVQRHIADMVRATLTAEYTDELRERVHKAVADKMTDDFVSKVIEAGFRNY